jgi:hypothetical protein
VYVQATARVKQITVWKHAVVMVHVTVLLTAVYATTVPVTTQQVTGAHCVKLRDVLVLMNHAVVMDNVFRVAVSVILAGQLMPPRAMCQIVLVHLTVMEMVLVILPGWYQPAHATRDIWVTSVNTHV